jgi:hypothetical protein
MENVNGVMPKYSRCAIKFSAFWSNSHPVSFAFVRGSIGQSETDFACGFNQKDNRLC